MLSHCNLTTVDFDWHQSETAWLRQSRTGCSGLHVSVIAVFSSNINKPHEREEEERKKKKNAPDLASSELNTVDVKQAYESIQSNSYSAYNRNIQNYQN